MYRNAGVFLCVNKTRGSSKKKILMRPSAPLAMERFKNSYIHNPLHMFRNRSNLADSRIS